MDSRKIVLQETGIVALGRLSSGKKDQSPPPVSFNDHD